MNSILALIEPHTAAAFVIGFILCFGLCCLGDAVRSAPDDAATPDWRLLYGAEQARFDRLQRLFERLRDLDDHSPAARPHELRAIQTEYERLMTLVETGPGTKDQGQGTETPQTCRLCKQPQLLDTEEGVKCLVCQHVEPREQKGGNL